MVLGRFGWFCVLVTTPISPLEFKWHRKARYLRNDRKSCLDLRSFRSMVRSFQVRSFQSIVRSFHKKVSSFHI